MALVLADHKLADTSGAELFALSRQLLPRQAGASRSLGRVAGPGSGGGDSAGGGPGASRLLPAQAVGLPHELFHAAITGFLYDFARAHPARPEVRVVGERWAPRSHELRDLLQRSAVSYTFLEPDSAEGQALLAAVGRSAALAGRGFTRRSDARCPDQRRARRRAGRGGRRPRHSGAGSLRRDHRRAGPAGSPPPSTRPRRG